MLGSVGILGGRLANRAFKSHQDLMAQAAGHDDRPAALAIDSHCHIPQAMHSCFAKVMEQQGVRLAISHGYWKGIDQDVATITDIRRHYPDRFAAFYAPTWDSSDPGYMKTSGLVTVTDTYLAETLPHDLERFMAAGGANALGLKLWRDVGARLRDTDGRVLRLTDPRLEPVLDRVRSLGGVVSVHACGKCHADRDALIGRHANLKFVLCHWGSEPHNLGTLRSILERHENVLVDTSPAAGWPTSKGYSQKDVHDFYQDFQDRLALGTDFVELGRQDCPRSGPDFWPNWYRKFWRYHQTWDEDFSSPSIPPKQWTGVGLGPEILRKVYWQNAYEFFGLARLIPDLGIATSNG